MMERQGKRTLTVEQQVTYLKDEKGVSFKLIGEDEARVLLERQEYFFRVKAFAKNFEKYNAPSSDRLGQYINLDFGHLVELSALDDALRELMLLLVLDIEHAMKVRINAAAMRCGADAYSIVSDFLDNVAEGVVKEQVGKFERTTGDSVLADLSEVVDEWRAGVDADGAVALANRANMAISKITLGKSPRYIEESFAIMQASPYSHNLVAKYSAENMPYWCLMELVSLGPLIRLYRACFRKGGFLPDELERENCKRVSKLLRCMRVMRNSAAHADHLLHELSQASKGTSFRAVRVALGEYGIGSAVADDVSRMSVAMDVAATLMCYDALVDSSGKRVVAGERLRRCRARFAEHADWFKKNYPITAFLSFANEAFEVFGRRFSCS